MAGAAYKEGSSVPAEKRVDCPVEERKACNITTGIVASASFPIGGFAERGGVGLVAHRKRQRFCAGSLGWFSYGGGNSQTGKKNT